MEPRKERSPDEVLDRTLRHLQLGSDPTAAAEAAGGANLQYDLLIRGGRVVDPATGFDQEPCDVAVLGGAVAARGPGLPGSAAEVFDATGLLVTAGLVDIHTHIYHLGTPLGLPPDEYCLSRGVTTAVDAGSAGATTVAGLKAFVADKVQTRVLALINASLHGLAAAWGAGKASRAGELDAITHVQVEEMFEAIKEFPDFVVGCKIRLCAGAADGGRNEREAYARVQAVCDKVGLPLMVHHNFCTVPITDCPGADASACGLRAGDIYTHAFHGLETHIIHDGKVKHSNILLEKILEDAPWMLLNVWSARRLNWSIMTRAHAQRTGPPRGVGGPASWRAIRRRARLAQGDTAIPHCR